MIRRPLGNTGLNVSVLGFGAGPVGSPELSESEAEALLKGVLDAGINLLDTAPSYGQSEERIGRALQGRRQDFVLSTKCGYGVPGVEDWTGPCITQGIDLALRRLRTDVIDIVHFHSCPVDVLERPGVVDALRHAVQQGKVRVAAYSGENAPLGWALHSGAFGSVQTSVNLFDQKVMDWALPMAREKGMGVIAKRPLGQCALAPSPSGPRLRTSRRIGTGCGRWVWIPRGWTGVSSRCASPPSCPEWRAASWGRRGWRISSATCTPWRRAPSPRPWWNGFAARSASMTTGGMG